MSLGWVITGTIAQLLLGAFLTMVVIFSGTGIANRNKLSRMQSDVLHLSMIILPLSSVFSAGMVLYAYFMEAGSASYWWYALPLCLTIPYLLFASRLLR